MGPNSDTGKGTLYINGEPLAEVGEIKIPLEVEPSDLPPILPMFLSLSQWIAPGGCGGSWRGGFSKPG